MRQNHDTHCEKWICTGWCRKTERRKFSRESIDVLRHACYFCISTLPSLAFRAEMDWSYYFNMAKPIVVIATLLAFITFLGVFLYLVGMLMHFGMCEIHLRLLQKQITALTTKLETSSSKPTEYILERIILRKLALKSFCL